MVNMSSRSQTDKTGLRPRVVVTRRLPDIIEARLRDLFDVTLRRDNTPMTQDCLLYTSPSPRDQRGSRMPSSA